MVLGFLKRAISGPHYESVQDFEDALWNLKYTYISQRSYQKRVSFAYRGLSLFPIEESYILYYDICKILNDTPYRFDWFYHLCLLLMYSHIVTGDPFNEPKYKSYFNRATHFCGLKHKRGTIISLCKSTSDSEKLRRELERIWKHERQRPQWSKNDRLLNDARQYVLKSKECDPDSLRYNIARNVGYNRAVKLIDLLTEEGTIRPQDNQNWRKGTLGKRLFEV